MTPEARRIVAPRWFDGTSLHANPVEVTVADGRIVGVRQPAGHSCGAATLTLPPDALLCPGFIDTHSHSDYSLVDDPGAVAAIIQGITTQVVGQCGFSAAPIDQGVHTKQTPDDPTYIATAARPTWTTMAEYRSSIAQRGCAVNVGALVGHNTLFAAASGNTSRVLELAEQAIDEGALGVSVGLSYHPGRTSSDQQIGDLMHLAGRRGVPYHTHMRYSSDETVDTLRQTLELARGRCGLVTISHVFPRRSDRTTTVDALLRTLEEQSEHFDSLTADMTVYASGGTPWSHGLPGWALGSGERLDAATSTNTRRRRLLRHLETSARGWVCDWSHLVITKVNDPGHGHLLGRTVADLAEEMGTSPAEAALDLLAADGHFWVSPPNKAWADVLDLLRHDLIIPMVDGITVDPRRRDRVVGLERSWNAFRRFLSKVVPEAPLDVAEALRRLTSEPARRIGLGDRGVIEPGAAADLVVLLPGAVTEVEPPDHSWRGKGILGVMVNGTWVMDPVTGDLTQRLPGEVV